MKEELQEVVQLVVARDQRGTASGVEARASCPTKDLLHIQDAKVLEAACLRVEDGGAFDDDGPRGQVDTPGQRGSAAENLKDAGEEHLLCEDAVGPQHACMVNTKAVVKHQRQLPVPRLRNLLPEVAILWVQAWIEVA